MPSAYSPSASPALAPKSLPQFRGQLCGAVAQRHGEGVLRGGSGAAIDHHGGAAESSMRMMESAVPAGLLRPIMAQFTDGYRTDGYRFEPDFLLADGDRVVVQARGYGTTAHGPYHQTYCFVFRLAGGRITEVIEHCDTALVERVLRPVTGSPAR